jgi:hypothetical protein
MPKWKTKDVAQFTHEEDPNSTIIGLVECLLCERKLQPTSPFVFPTVDDAVKKHMGDTHADHLNAAGVQRVPDGEGGLVYYVILNP